MNAQLKTILLTVLTLSVFVIALVELSGVSNTALFNKYSIGNGGTGQMTNGTPDEQQKKDAQRKAMPKTTISFVDTKHNFGTITEGEVVKHAYKFKNTGEHPLLISNAVASCGCTVPSYPKEPIAPGAESEVVVEFNSKNRPGHQKKNVLIYSNAQEEAMSIGFDVDVKEK
ncbi:DUF1573 domain-containing protein [Polluticoccus soli]|uniref:DUF1573 domain-containing protein n=1 Tax=Polluticoccus soli TaxID=3034150 RepID=UPI0023E15855|nr:DUF1573 domain-containing protein [Flavipsychrobacter sp. JY13-12]